MLSSILRNIKSLKGSNKLVNNQSIKMLSTATSSKDLFFRQMFDCETCTYTYLLADKSSKEAVLIDPVMERAYRDARLVLQLGLKLMYVMNTHVHADHITGTGILKSLIPGCRSLLAQEYGTGCADIMVKPGDEVRFGGQKLEVRSTPGHTNGCITFVDHRNEIAFTGDALLIRGCGRTDFQEGDADRLFTSVHSQIFTLPMHYHLYPAHDYNGQSVTTVEEEKIFNPRLTKSRKEFVELMENLDIPYPAKIDESLPANKVCGLYNLPERLETMLKISKPL